MNNKLGLDVLLHNYRSVSQTQREKGTYFEELILAYLRNEPTYKDLYVVFSMGKLLERLKFKP